MSQILLSIFYFILAGIAEIGGGYLVWLYLKDDKSPWYMLAGAITLIIYVLFLLYKKPLSVRSMLPMVASSSPFLFYGAIMWTVLLLIGTISLVALSPLLGY